MTSMTLPPFLWKRKEQTPDRIAVMQGEQKWTFRQLWNEATALARGWEQAGLQKEARIGFFARNRWESIVALHAGMLLHCPIVCLNRRLTPSELRWQTENSKLSALYCDKDDAVKWLPESVLKLPVHVENISSNNSFLEEISLEDPCTLMYTSGTTGTPKAVVQTYGNHFFNATASLFHLGSEREDVWGCPVPLFHISGFSIVMRSCLYGMPLRLYETFDPAALANDMQVGRITIVSFVATMLQRVLGEWDENTVHPSFRTVLLGGGPATKSLLDEAKKRGIPLLQTYGMTETASQIATLSQEDAVRKLGSSGKPLFGTSIQVVTAEGQQVRRGEIGELIVKGPTVTPGYDELPEANATSFLKDGWFRTGDVGYIDEEGYLFVVDRRKDLIISGGENIYPKEIEEVLASFAGIKEAAVCGRADATWGAVPVAFVVWEVGEKNLVALQRHVEQHLAKFKHPVAYHEVDELPRNASQKILRYKLQEWDEKWREQS
ncbi:o-succinylbenzoate--CoA ligase [Bacillus fonticola]|uniref:o-succinylbenzoate--CoA ligase n=1 Tax=Bacillus fonticola TaxID=2728853 RepID=UPI001474DA9E|nr:o-succinylbenzoate--CoA ligase [Bacillus fonticola]